VKVAGNWRYVCRATDEHGQVIDAFDSPRRNIAAARGFFTAALSAHGEPEEVITDLVSQHRAIRQQSCRVRSRVTQSQAQTNARSPD